MNDCVSTRAHILSEARQLPENDDIFRVYFYNTISRHFGPRENRCGEINYSEVFPLYASEKISEILQHCSRILKFAYPLGDAAHDDNDVLYSKIYNTMKEEFSMFGEETYKSISVHGQYIAR